ncbi:glycoside hydrolase 3 protein [Irineochytrium annulatum]|nr:glycoside hydrolase 3 protein [Irineochytrium annulatum]
MVQNKGAPSLQPGPPQSGSKKPPSPGLASALPNKVPSPSLKPQIINAFALNAVGLGIADQPRSSSLIHDDGNDLDLRGNQQPGGGAAAASPPKKVVGGHAGWKDTAAATRVGLSGPNVASGETIMIDVDDYTSWTAFVSLLEMYQDYGYKLAEDSCHADLIQRKLNTAPKKFDYDLAEFFLHVSTIVYEPTQVVETFLARWKESVSDLKYARCGQEGCVFLAMWSVKRNFVVFSFKGTSPFDLTEWLTDASMRKSPPRNGLLPGLMHTGFYTSFGFPKKDIVSAEKLIIDDLFKAALESNGANPIPCTAFAADSKKGGSHESTPDFWKSIFYPQILSILSHFPNKPKRARPNLWITGHSLGAASASIFASMLLWTSRSDCGRGSPVCKQEWDKCFTLRGAYTFGTPRVGDADFTSNITQVMDLKYSPDGKDFKLYRVVNANDIVCDAPGVSKSLGAYLRDKKWRPSLSLRAARKRGRMDWDNEERDRCSKPGGVTMNDFEHIGEEVLLGLRDGYIAYKERDLRDILRTWCVEAVRSVPDLVGPGRNVWVRVMALATVVTFGGAGFIKDHAPSEYLANLALARKKNPNGPTCGACAAPNDVLSDLRLIRDLTTRVKTFYLVDGGCADGSTVLEANAILDHPLEVWLGLGFDGTRARYDTEIRELTHLLRRRPALFDHVGAIIVGSENMFRAELTDADLVSRIGDVRALLARELPRKKANVTVADIGGPIYSDPLIEAVDVLMINLYPYWESKAVEDASEYQFGRLAEIGARARGKDVVLGEIGWPTQGESAGAAVPSVENLGKFMQDWRCKADRVGQGYFWFEFNDEG